MSVCVGATGSRGVEEDSECIIEECPAEDTNEEYWSTQGVGPDPVSGRGHRR